MAHTEDTTKCLLAQTCQVLALLSLLTLGLLGRPVASQAGWVACPPILPYLPATATRRNTRSTSCPAAVRSLAQRPI